jgi:hypothetical protein
VNKQNVFSLFEVTLARQANQPRHDFSGVHGVKQYRLGARAAEGAQAKIGPSDGQVFDDFAGEYLDIWQISGEK